MLSVAVDEKFAKDIDNVIRSTGAYASRSEFLKDAIRKNIAETRQLGEELKKTREATRKLAALARSRGYTGGLLTQREKDKIAREFIREHCL